MQSTKLASAKWIGGILLGGILTIFVSLAGPVGAQTMAPGMAPGSAGEPSVAGLWQKVDAQTGNSVGWFLFVPRDNNTYEGAIAKLFLRPGDAPNPTCSNCRDDRKDQPLLGLSLIRDMKRSGLVYRDGNILDPRDGNIYSAMMTVSPDGQSLTVRGYLGIALFGRDEIWYRLPETAYKELDPIVVAHYLPDQVKMSRAPASRHPEKTAKSGNPPLR
jgi:uncharacterized protein (DUF2147 family)